MLIYSVIGLTAVVILFVCYILSLRRIVPTNEVHIVQRDKRTISYGRDAKDDAGNTYYKIPTWVPKFGVVVSVLPTTIIDIDINGYDAYDKDRLPFLVDIKAFFRVSNFNLAASRVYSVPELKGQLEAIVKGAARSILAKEDLEVIMGERNKYGEMFTALVTAQLKEWGVESVKNIELMDIRDSQHEEVIANIMKKKKSAIEMESRKTVAENLQKAQEAEILAKQEIELKRQDAEQQVGMKQAAVQQKVGIANEKQKQEVQAEAKITAEKQMEVKQVNEVRSAEIEKQAATVKAEQDKEVTRVNADASIIKTEAEKKVAILNAEAEQQQKVINAEADKERTILSAQATKEQIELKADADLKAATNEAKGIKLKGESTASARELLEKAQVAGQIELSEKIGNNKEYQDFVVAQKQVEAMQAIGIEQAKNLSGAEVKIYATAGNVAEGATKAGGVFTPSNGVNLASTLEAFTNTEIGKQIADKFLKKEDK